MISVAAELRSIRSGMPFHKIEQTLTGNRVSVAWEFPAPSESSGPRPQLEDILAVSLTVGACCPFAAGTPSLGFLMSNKQSVT